MKKTEIIYAVHPIQSVLEQDPSRLLQVFTLQDHKNPRTQQLVHHLKNIGISVQSVNKKTLDQQSNGANHQGIMAQVRPLPTLNEHDLEHILAQQQKPLFLILDGVTDPHNLGACLRNADAAGVAAVIVPKNKSADISPVVSKVACGAAETVPFIRVTNLSRTMKRLQEENVWIVGTSGDASQSLYQSELTGPLALVMGAEGEGMRRLTREHCDLRVSLPMAGQVSSLNVSVASGVCLFEAVRQRQSLS